MHDLRPAARRLGLALALGAGLLGTSGCNIVGFGGVMVESYRRNSTKTIEPEYKGLAGKKWAVVVIADRSIQADYPNQVSYLTAQITQKLSDPKQGQDKIGAAGCIPAPTLLQYLYEHPNWVAMRRGALAKQLGVDRLIFVELIEYRLNDPGNQYLWSGLATGTLGVIEADSAVPDEFAFEKQISVKFPDKDGFGPQDMNTSVVTTSLSSRFVDRCAWLFYQHEEPYYPKY